MLKGTPEVITIGQTNQIRVTTKYLIDQQGAEIDSLVNYTVYQGFKPMIGDTVSFETWNTNYLMNTQKVGPTIARDITIQAIWAVLFVLVIIAVYIIIRSETGPLVWEQLFPCCMTFS